MKPAIRQNKEDKTIHYAQNDFRDYVMHSSGRKGNQKEPTKPYKYDEGNTLNALVNYATRLGLGSRIVDAIRHAIISEATYQRLAKAYREQDDREFIAACKSDNFMAGVQVKPGKSRYVY